MRLMIEEYGKAVLYFLIASIAIGAMYNATKRSSDVVQEDPKSTVGSNSVLLEKTKPSLTILNTWIQKGTQFNPLQYVKALDSQGMTITDQVQCFGDVDTSKKGKYDVKYIVRDKYGLLTKKIVTFVVD